MSAIILIVEHNSSWTQYGPGSVILQRGAPSGLRQAIERGAELIEQLDSRESKTASSDHHYTKWRVRFPIRLIPELKLGQFDGLKPTVDIPI